MVQVRMYSALAAIFFFCMQISCSQETANSRFDLSKNNLNASDVEQDNEISDPYSSDSSYPTETESVMTGEELAAEKIDIEFSGVQGDRVPGYLWLPKRQAGEKLPAVLAMYGINGDKNSGDIAEAALQLNERGIAAMTIDWPGTGERGDIDSFQRIASKELLSQTVGDYGKALDFLSERPDVDGERLGYVGASMGAMTGTKFSAEDSRVKAFVPLVPIPNPLWGSDNPVSKIKTAPAATFCICSTQDSSCNVCQNSPGQQKSYDVGHELDSVREEVLDLAADFLVERL